MPRSRRGSSAPTFDARPVAPRDRTAWRLTEAGLFLAVFGTTLAVIARYGVNLPLWDQWGAEGLLLYDPYLQGRLSFAALIGPYNEHHILFTRLLDLLLLELAGGWDPLSQMVAEAALRAVFALVLLYGLRPLLPGRAGRVAAVPPAVALAIPFAWENVLLGFQSEFVLVMIAATASIGLCLGRPSLSRGWWAGVLMGVAAFFNIASGALVLLVCAAVAVLQRRGFNRREGFAIAVQLALVAAMLAATLMLVAQSPLQRRTLAEYGLALEQIVGWPIPASPAGPLIVFAPSALLAVALVRSRAPLHDRGWMCLGLALWALAQHATLVYGRSEGIMAPRYRDVAMLGLIANAAALVRLTPAWRLAPRRFLLVVGLGSAWAVLIADGLVAMAGPIRHELDLKARDGPVQMAAMRAYLATGDRDVLRQGAATVLPDPEALAAVADRPTIRGLLPKELIADRPARQAVQQRLLTKGALGSPVRHLRAFLLRWARSIAAIGGVLLLAGVVYAPRRTATHL